MSDWPFFQEVKNMEKQGGQLMDKKTEATSRARDDGGRYNPSPSPETMAEFARLVSQMLEVPRGCGM